MRLLHGRPLAERLSAATKERAAALAPAGVAPRLAIVSVGIDPTAVAYEERLRRSGKQAGVEVRHVALPRGTTEAEVAATLDGLGRDDATSGILLLTPLPAPLDDGRLVARIAAEKDVEGMHPENVGLLWSGRPRFVPSTAEAILELLRAYEVPLRGTHATIVGRSNVVGRPLAALLLEADATVTVAHSHTADLAQRTRDASLVVVAVGRERFLTGDMVSAGATVVDAGINVTPSGIVGDVDAKSVSAVAGALSPVPGGLGAVTTALLLRNVVRAAEEQRGAGRSR